MAFLGLASECPAGVKPLIRKYFCNRKNLEASRKSNGIVEIAPCLLTLPLTVQNLLSLNTELSVNYKIGSNHL